MKKILFYVLIIGTALSFNACSKDDNKEDATGSILGKWYFENMVMKAHVIEDGENFNMEMTASNPNPPIYGEFHADGTYTGQNGVMMAHVVVTGSINMNYDMPISNSLPSNGTWSKNGDLITFQEGNEEPSTYKIETLSATRLVLFADQNTANFPMDDMEGVESFSVRVTMRR